jgi:hypothetical protein
MYGITVKSFAPLHYYNSLRQTIISSKIGHIARWLGVMLHKHAATRTIPGLWFILVGCRCLCGPIHGQTNLRNRVLYNKRLCPYTIQVRADFSLLANVITKTCPKLHVWQLFLLMRRRKRPYTGRGKGVFGQKIGCKEEVYNCIISCHNSLFAFVCFILKRRRERYENQWWTGDVIQELANMSIHASNGCISSQTTPHTISLRSSLCCANCLTVFGALNACITVV